MIEQAGGAAIDLRDLVDAKETAGDFDSGKARPPKLGPDKGKHDQAEEARRPVALYQHERSEPYQSRPERDIPSVMYLLSPTE